MYQSDTAPWLWFRAWNTDGSAKTDLVFNTSGISIKVARDNQADSSALSLSAASSPTDWAAGKFLQVVGNLYKVGIATASISSYTGNIAICGSYTGGTIEGVLDYVSAYNPAGNPNTTTPPTAAANATQVRTELGTELARIDATISSRSTYAGGDTAGVTTLLSRLSSTRAGNLDNLDLAISVVQSQITALNNLSAKANWFGALLLEVPDSGTRAYVFELVVKDDEDKLVNLDSSPTIALTNAAGTDRSALITTTIANPSTGRYTLTITVGTSTVNESLKLTASGTVSGEARYAVIAPQVVDYDNATQVALLLTRIGTPNVSVAADIATRASQTSVDTIDDLLDTEMPALTAAVAAEAVKTSNIQTRLPTALESGRIAAVLDSARGAQLDAIEADAAAAVGYLTTLVTRITSSAASLFANLAAMLTGSGNAAKFTASALENAPSGEVSGGLTDEQDARLITIASQTAQINGSRLQLAGPVTAGGEISLVVGSDYVEDLDSSLIRTVTDTGGVLHGKLTAGQLTDLVFSAAPSAKSKSPARITGEVTAVAHAGGITIITIEIERANIPAGPYSDDWKYQIWRTADSLVTPPLLEGSLILHWRT